MTSKVWAALLQIEEEARALLEEMERLRLERDEARQALAENDKRWERIVHGVQADAQRCKDRSRGRPGNEGWVSYGQGMDEGCEEILDRTKKEQG